MISILLADDHQTMRLGLRSLLQEIVGFQVCGEIADGYGLIAALQQHQPDVLVLDLLMPGLPIPDALGQIKQVVPDTRIIIYSMHADEDMVLQVLAMGAVGYVLKGSPAIELVQAVQAVMQGSRFLSPRLINRSATLKDESSMANPLELLTEREREVLRLLGAGRTSAQVAAQLRISLRTVAFHRANLTKKLNLTSAAELIRFAVQHEKRAR